jgi:hypothetical protein
MKKLLWLLFLPLLPQLSKAQNYHQLIFSINSPIIYSGSTPNRRIGIETGYLFGWRLNDHFAIETGLTMDLFGRFNYNITTYNWNTWQPETITNSYWRVCLNLPVLVSINLGQFEIKNGVELDFKSLFGDSKYPGFTLDSPYYEEKGVPIGISYYGIISYHLNEKLSPFLDFKSLFLGLFPKFTRPNYSLLGLGVIYRLNSKK